MMLHIFHRAAHDNTILQLQAMLLVKNPGRPAAAPQKLKTRLI